MGHSTSDWIVAIQIGETNIRDIAQQIVTWSRGWA
jgi:hypothetical protein